MNSAFHIRTSDRIDADRASAVSIALGLTVLSFLFLLAHVPIEAVALKLFTGIENF